MAQWFPAWDRQFDSEPGGGFADADTWDEALGPTDEAVGYASNVRFGTALFNAATPGGITNNPYGSDSLEGRENFGIDEYTAPPGGNTETTINLPEITDGSGLPGMNLNGMVWKLALFLALLVGLNAFAGGAGEGLTS